MKKIAFLLLLALTGCGEPAEIIREEVISSAVTEFSEVRRVRMSPYTDIRVVGPAVDTHIAIPVCNNMSNDIIGHKIEVKKQIDTGARIHYQIMPDYNTVRAELVAKYCW